MVLDFKVNVRLVVGMTINFFAPDFQPFSGAVEIPLRCGRAPYNKNETQSPPLHLILYSFFAKMFCIWKIFVKFAVIRGTSVAI